MANSGSFAVSIKLIDLATSPINSVNKAIAGLEKTTKQAARQGGLFEIKDALSKIRRDAGDLGDKLGTVFTPLGGLTAAGSLAGMAALAQRFAQTGAEVGRTSALLGVGTRDLQNWRGAMRLAGGSAEDATSLIANVGKTLYEARAGSRPDVFRGATQFGLDISKGKGDIGFMLDAADRLQAIGDPQERRKFAEVFNFDEKTLTLLSKGRSAVRAYLDEAERHGRLTQTQIEAAEALHFAYTGLELSVELTGNAIGGQIGTWMTPMLKKWSEWLDRARETPATMKLVEIGGEALAAVFGVTMVSALGRLLFAANAVWAAPLFKVLLANPWLAGLIAGGAVLMPGSANEGEPNTSFKGKAPGVEVSHLTPQQAQQMLDTGHDLPEELRRKLEERARGGQPGGAQPSAAGDNRTFLDRAFDWLGIRTPNAPGTQSSGTPRASLNPISPAAAMGTGGLRAAAGAGAIPPGSATTTAVPPEARGILAAIASRESEGAARRLGVSPYNVRYSPRGGAAFSDLSKHPGIMEPGPAGMPSAAGRYQFTRTTWRAYAKKLNLPDFRPESQDEAGWADAQDTYRRAVGRDLGTDLRNNNFDRRAIPAFKREWTSVRGDLPELANRFGSRAQPYAPPVQSVGGDAAAGLGPTGDTNHRVEVHFANAPAGMSSGLTRAEGPAETSIRTQYSMPHI